MYIVVVDVDGDVDEDGVDEDVVDVGIFRLSTAI